MSRFQYDTDDIDFDDFEYAMEDMDGGLFDKHTDKREDGVSKARESGRGSVYEIAQALDERELLNDDGDLPDDFEQHMAGMTEEELDEFELLVIRADGEFPVVWEAMEEHNLFHNPSEKQYEYERQQERYWACVGWERFRARKSKKERYKNAPDYYRERRQKTDAVWYERNREEILERKRENLARRLARLGDEERRRMERERKRLYRQRQKEAKKNGN